MKGSLIEAMSQAIEGADVMIFGVSAAYKESANCKRALQCDDCFAALIYS